MNKPIILDNALDRIGDDNKIFEYDYSKDMNIVKRGNLTTAFIDIDHVKSNELYTKTDVARERDDEEISLLELCSKSEITRERDDEEINLLELSTKTKQERERDDEEMSLVELFSKTFVERERDDEDDISFN